MEFLLGTLPPVSIHAPAIRRDDGAVWVVPAARMFQSTRPRLGATRLKILRASIE